MAKVHTTVKSALTRLTILFGASLILCMSSGAAVALAGKTTTQPTNSAQYQYTENVPKVNGKKHTATRHKTSTGSKSTTTTTSVGGTTTKHVGGKKTTTAHHTTKGHGKKHHRTRKGKKHAVHTAVSNHKAQTRSHVATGQPAAAVTTSSGGGISTWLLVVLILVLVSGSAAGILRYRRNH